MDHQQVENELAAMAWPSTKQNLNFIWQNGIRHLVTLSPEMVPPVAGSKLKWDLIPVEEFEAPTLDDILQFIRICSQSISINESVGVHCRMGRGRTGVMAACFLVHFHGINPHSAILKLRLERPGSVETYEQERVVHRYYDYLMGTRMKETIT
ncbi:hypothetical protein NQ317_013386 [Molorchus minor]|uniref:Tyrosine specific protein phosphatases domain-containing protein n=1 Tax=Molorchus minor TaxID=1323400 RepID=A0ABQ9JPA3_9CUCU|nr:hypothetical protein NQ317_013386 [Molorchus minor]